VPTFSAGSASVNIVPDFSNAQRMISSWFKGQKDIQVAVEPNLDQTAYARIQAQLHAMPDHTVHVNIDTKHFAAEVAKITDALVGITLVEDVFRRVFGARSVLMTTGVGALTAIAGAAAQAGGALLLLPAALTAVAAPIATITLGVQGMGDAFKAFGTGDIDKINKAMANLAPSARDFVTQVHSLGPAFKDLRLDVQQQLFQGLGGTVSTLAKDYLPALHESLGGVAQALNGVGKEIIGVIGTKATIADFSTTWINVANAIQASGPGIASIVKMFGDLVTVGSEFLPGIAEGFSKAAAAAATWVSNARQTGVLNDIIARALDMLKQLGALVFNVGSVLMDIFKAAAGTGGQLLDILNQLFGSLHDFLTTDIGQSGLHTFFTNIGTAVQTILPGISALIQAVVTGLLPAMSGLAASVAPIANTILVQLADMVKQLAPLFYPAFADAIAAILGALAPLIPVLTEIGKTLFPVLTQVLQAIAPVITQVAEAFGDALLLVLKDLTPILPMLVQAISDLAQAFLPLLPVLLNLIETLLPPLVELLGAIIPVVVHIVEAVMPAFIAIVQALTPVIQLLGDVINWAFKEILGPAIIWAVDNVVVPYLNLAAATFSALATGIKWAFDNIIKPTWDALQAALLWLWQNVLYPTFKAIGDMWAALWNDAKMVWENILKPTWDAIAAAAKLLWEVWLKPAWDAMKSAWEGLMNGMRWMYDNVVHPMWQIFMDAVHAVGDVFSRVVDAISGAWSRLQGIAAAPINFIVRTVLRDGLFTAWNWLLDQLGIGSWHVDLHAPYLQGIAGYAAGGQVTDAQDATGGGAVRGQKRGSRADNVLGLLTPDEFVIQQPIANRIRPFLEALNSGQAEAVQAAGGWYANPPALRAYAAGGNVQRAIDIAAAMTGKPYIWGGAGPNGADCSGFQSILTRAMRGEANPYARIGSTATFPWPGFVSGFGTPYTIGNTRNAFNSGVGHMAGTLDSHRVESGSGHGPMLDASALGANAPLFTTHAWLANFAGAAASSSGAIDKPWWSDLWSDITGAKNWLFGKLGDISALVSRFGDSPFTQWLWGAVKQLPGFAWDKVKDAIGSLFGTNNDAAGVKGIVQGIFANAGWTGDQWAAADWVISHESGWNPQAQNPTSSASGLFQMIDSTWHAYGNHQYAHMKDAPAADQGMAGRRYIAERYGDPLGAKAFWVGHHYYDRGGWIPPGISTVWNATGRPEPVLTAAEHDSLLRWRGLGAGVGGQQALMGDVHIHAEQSKAGEIMDELWHRLRVARRGGVYSTASVYTVG
jgi:phage-related protein